MGTNKEKSLAEKVREIRAKYTTARSDDSFVFMKVLQSEGLRLEYSQRWALSGIHEKYRLDSIFREIRRQEQAEKANTLQTVPMRLIEEPVKKPSVFHRIFGRK